MDANLTRALARPDHDRGQQTPLYHVQPSHLILHTAAGGPTINQGTLELVHPASRLSVDAGIAFGAAVIHPLV